LEDFLKVSKVVIVSAKNQNLDCWSAESDIGNASSRKQMLFQVLIKPLYQTSTASSVLMIPRVEQVDILMWFQGKKSALFFRRNVKKIVIPEMLYRKWEKNMEKTGPAEDKRE
jgi:hypothetical protein